MQSAIKDIYYGNTDKDNIKLTEEYKRLGKKLMEIYNEFYESLNEKQKQQFEEIYEYEVGQQAESELQHYKTGFMLGLKLGLEVLSD